MTNPLKGETVLVVGAKRFTLALDLDAICAMEGVLGMGMLKMLPLLQEGSMSVVRAAIWAGLRQHHAKDEIDLKAAGELIGKAGGLLKVLPVVAEAFRLGLPQADDAPGEGEGDAPPSPRKAPARRASRGTGRSST